MSRKPFVRMIAPPRPSSYVGERETTYACATAGCRSAVALTEREPLPDRWRVRVTRARGGSRSYAYVCPECAREEVA